MATAYMFNPPKKEYTSKKKPIVGLASSKKSLPGVALSTTPLIFARGARKTHKPSSRVGKRKIQSLLGPGKHYAHRITYWSRYPEGGDEGVRSPMYIRNSKHTKEVKKVMARRKKHRKYARKAKRMFKRNPRRGSRKAKLVIMKANPSGRHRKSRKYSANPRKAKRSSREFGITKYFKNPAIMGYNVKDVLVTAGFGAIGFVASKSLAKFASEKYNPTADPAKETLTKVIYHSTALFGPLALAWTVKKFAKKDEWAKAIAVGGLVSFGLGITQMLFAKMSVTQPSWLSFGAYIPDSGYAGYVPSNGYDGMAEVTNEELRNEDHYSPLYS